MFDFSSHNYVYCAYIIFYTLFFAIVTLFYLNYTILLVSLYLHIGNSLKGVNIDLQILQEDWLEFANDKKSENEDLKKLRDLMLFHKSAIEYFPYV